MPIAYLGIGSNLGDRLAQLRFAAGALENHAGVQAVRLSPIYQTAPVGPVEQDDFLNAVIEINASLAPEELLDVALNLENQTGRIRAERWGPRTLDIDLLAYDQLIQSTPRLTLPHPEAEKRAFVLVPWADLAPEFPLKGVAIRNWRQRIDDAGVRKFDGAQ